MGSDLPIVDLGAGWTIIEVAAGSFHTCARLQSEATLAVKCWGQNNWGQLGLGDANNRGDVVGEMGNSLPEVDLGTGRSALALALGREHSCALLDDETVKCWGQNNWGQLGLGHASNRGGGDGHMGDSLPAVDLGAGRVVARLVAGDHHTCVLLRDDLRLCVPSPSAGWVPLSGSSAPGGIVYPHFKGDLYGSRGDLLYKPRISHFLYGVNLYGIRPVPLASQRVLSSA